VHAMWHKIRLSALYTVSVLDELAEPTMILAGPDNDKLRGHGQERAGRSGKLVFSMGTS
jgi:hypothetical protein